MNLFTKKKPGLQYRVTTISVFKSHKRDYKFLEFLKKKKKLSMVANFYIRRANKGKRISVSTGPDEFTQQVAR